MARFALLCHEGPRGRHWDLLLEAGAVLKAWALAQPPESEVEIRCEVLPDHRLLYLDYEGPISGDRGTVVRCDAGTCEWKDESQGGFVVELRGAKLIGRVYLRQLPGQGNQWRFRWTKEKGT